MKPIGSEKLTGMDKIQRIIEIANYNTANNTVNESTTEYTKYAVDGNTYAIVKEKDGYYVKVGLNESSLDYVDGILNKNRYRFNSYSGALKKLNLMIKPLNEQFNEGKEDPVLNETKYVLKKPASAPVEEPVMDEPVAEPASDELDLSGLDLGSEEPAMEPEMGEEPAMEPEMGEEPAIEPEMGPESSEEEGGDKLKKVQKLTGKLGQALRDMKIDLESSDIKYVLNSIISAVDLTKLNEEDLEGVMENFEELENFEIEGGEPTSDEELDMDLDMEVADSEDDDIEAEINEYFFDGMDLGDGEVSNFDRAGDYEDSGDEDDYRPMSDRESFEGDIDENAFMDGLKTLGSKFVNYYNTNPEGRQMINKIGSDMVSKGTDKVASELDKSEKFDKSGKVSSTLKGVNPSGEDIDKLGKMIFGDLNEDEVSKKIDDVLGKYFL
jgi:hypothetical protein